MQAYITILGRSIWAVINSLYAVLKQTDNKPDVIYVVTESIFRDKLDKTVEGVKIVLDHFGFHAAVSTMIVAEGNLTAAGKAVGGLAKKLNDKGYDIIVDITPGRKSLVAGTLLALKKDQVSHIFYLDIKTIEDVNYPFEMIPKQIQSLKDFLQEGGDSRAEAEAVEDA
jgi:hypothetical protein